MHLYVSKQIFFCQQHRVSRTTYDIREHTKGSQHILILFCFNPYITIIIIIIISSSSSSSSSSSIIFGIITNLLI
jgi:hypothetical protein